MSLKVYRVLIPLTALTFNNSNKKVFSNAQINSFHLQVEIRYLPYLCQDKDLKGTVVNRICLSKNERSPEVTLTVPLRLLYVVVISSDPPFEEGHVQFTY